MSFLVHFVAVFFPITNTIAGIFHFREKCQPSVFICCILNMRRTPFVFVWSKLIIQQGAPSLFIFSLMH